MQTYVSLWRKFYKKNYYYHNDAYELVKRLLPADASVLEIGSKDGVLLRKIPNREKVGVTNSYFLKENRGVNLVDIEKFPENLKGKKFDYVLINHFFSESLDVQLFVRKLDKVIHEDSVIIVIFFNFLWKPVLDIAAKLGLKLPQERSPNWLTPQDIRNTFYLENYYEVMSGKRFLFPFKIPVLSSLLNSYLSQLPLVNNFCLTNFAIFRPQAKAKDLSVSIVIPARNEEGNIRGILSKIPRLGIKTEIIFVEGHSKDNTYQEITKEIKKYKGASTVKLVKQKGQGKYDAVRLGFSKAKNDLLMILDADLSVTPVELTKFYKAASEAKGQLIIGSRLVYPLEGEAMRAINYLGNKIFSILFTFILGQEIKDTLCGTKAIFKKDYRRLIKATKIFKNLDPFGDFDLIFGAARLNFKMVEVPVRYKRRLYGATNIKRFQHGFLLLKMVAVAVRTFKFF